MTSEQYRGRTEITRPSISEGLRGTCIRILDSLASKDLQSREVTVSQMLSELDFDDSLIDGSEVIGNLGRIPIEVNDTACELGVVFTSFDKEAKASELSSPVGETTYGLPRAIFSIDTTSRKEGDSSDGDILGLVYVYKENVVQYDFSHFTHPSTNRKRLANLVTIMKSLGLDKNVLQTNSEQTGFYTNFQLMQFNKFLQFLNNDGFGEGFNDISIVN